MGDISWKVLLVVKLVLGLDARLVYAEATFNAGDLDTEIYMEPPPHLEEHSNLDRNQECMKLNRYTYGLV